VSDATHIFSCFFPLDTTGGQRAMSCLRTDHPVEKRQPHSHSSMATTEPWSQYHRKCLADTYIIKTKRWYTIYTAAPYIFPQNGDVNYLSVNEQGTYLIFQYLVICLFPLITALNRGRILWNRLYTVKWKFIQIYMARQCILYTNADKNIFFYLWFTKKTLAINVLCKHTEYINIIGDQCPV
jgi:hypothetical protein